MNGPDSQTSVPSNRLRRRVWAVALSVVVASAVWLVARLAGAQLEAASPLAGAMTVDLPSVIGASLFGGLAGWGSLVVLERLSSRPRRLWTGAAVGVLLASLVPLAVLDATTGTKVALGLMHIATGLPLVLLLHRTSVATKERALTTPDGRWPTSHARRHAWQVA